VNNSLLYANLHDEVKGHDKPGFANNNHNIHFFNGRDSTSPSARANFVEIHCDYVDEFLLGGDSDLELSVRFKRNFNSAGEPATDADREVVLLGQDETIFYSNMMSSRSWFYKNQQKLEPKGPGASFMVSGVTSRKWGFGLELTGPELARVNAFRRDKMPEYMSASAATEVMGTTAKADLIDSRFVVFFEQGSGSNKEGWWDGDNMIIQMEDIMDVMTALYPEYEIAFLLDHSAGHGKRVEGGLSIYGMNAKLGGRVVTMKETMITEGCLGTHAVENADGTAFRGRAKVGEGQSMVFSAGEKPRFQTEVKEDDSVGPLVERNRTKDELTTALRQAGVTTSENSKMKGMKAVELREFAEQKRVDLQVRGPSTTEGYAGKPKGMLQVA